MKKTLLVAVLGAALATPFVAQAAANDAGVHFILSGGLTAGGDTIVTANYTNGRSDNIKGGGLVQLGGGVLWQAANMPLAASFTVNYHVDNASASNGEARFDRMPLEAIVYYTGVAKWRFGAGVRSVQSAKAIYEVNGAKETLKFKDATGTLVEAGYGLTPNAWINVRYVSEKYKPSSFTSVSGQTSTIVNPVSVDGSHVGVNFLYQF